MALERLNWVEPPFVFTSYRDPIKNYHGLVPHDLIEKIQSLHWLYVRVEGRQDTRLAGVRGESITILYVTLFLRVAWLPPDLCLGIATDF